VPLNKTVRSGRPRVNRRREKRILVYLASLVLFLALWAILLLVPGPDIPFQASQPGVADNLEENGDLYESQRPWPRLVFVIDDVGYSLEELQPFLELPFPLTFAGSAFFGK
jgi:hypothetical protein